MPSDADLLKAYLADRDVPCPGCGYSLKGCASEKCPECGAGIVFGISEQPWLLRRKRLLCFAAWIAMAYHLTYAIALVRSLLFDPTGALIYVFTTWWVLIYVPTWIGLFAGGYFLTRLLMALHRRVPAPSAWIETLVGWYLPFGMCFLASKIVLEWISRLIH